MRKLVAPREWISFDGVIQAPGDPDKDRPAFRTAVGISTIPTGTSMRWVVENLTEGSRLRARTPHVRGSARHWPNASDEEQPVAEPLNLKPKYVASTYSASRSPGCSILLKGDLARTRSQR